MEHSLSEDPSVASTLDGVHKALVLFVTLNSGVVNVRDGGEVGSLIALVLVGDGLLLVSVEAEHVALLLGGKSLVGSCALENLILEDREDRVVLVGHGSIANSGKSSLEGSLSDGFALDGVGEGGVHLLEGTLSDAGEEELEVGLFVAFDGGEHVLSAAVEVVLEVVAAVGEVVNEGALLDEVVLLVDADVLHLGLGVHEVDHLALLGNVSPLAGELLSLVTGVHIVEDGELGTEHEGEVAELNVAEVDSEQVLVMEDHVTDPLVVGPAAKTRDGGDGTNVGEEENESTAGAGEGLVMGGDLLGADSLEEGLHVVVVGEDEGVGISVVGVHVAGGSIAELVGVVTFTIFGFVLRLGPARTQVRNLILTSSWETFGGSRDGPGTQTRSGRRW
jgi:hypothetical protein